MQKLNKLQALFRALTAAIAACISTATFAQLRPQLQSTTPLVFITVIVVAVFIVAFESILNWIFSSSKAFRGMVIGGESIEGVWEDYTKDITGQDIRHVVLLHIYYRDGEYKASGVTFDCKGNQIATFHSTSAAYKNSLFYYQYDSHKDYGEGPIEIGVTRLQFDFPAQSYTGFWFDFSGVEQGRVRGKRVQEAYLKDHNGLKDFESKCAYAKEVFARLNGCSASAES